MPYMTIEQFRQIYDDWKRSGLSVQQYCENTGLTESRFDYWRAKIQAESLPSSCGSFIPVKMSGKTSVCSAKNASGKALCEIEYPNGVVVRVTTDMTLDQLRQELSYPVIRGLEAWALNEKDAVMPKSPIGKAIGYLLELLPHNLKQKGIL